ncbi:LOW QUALITY PROTEIN: hypothetical protein CH63R_08670 [Colletotrichum higginsianum IMI 349063]|uniref:Uncharacterized protein n=1 Tax=Colletotrichum higginsianum (strain IMI 349063) TaxID=759273 RepID=A0A1B7Y522_COLHI|nr:LOW QUALITY PROTEIN: hypothetical protein CH63R_08670 [Colletotrichum higginsianum IMI 349063]OBR07149.1 LOW QUALITY PROTEIN: hypothetical protein CH63R_08670 [Colletotrichum higginsianum IMI 349063]
MERRIQSGSSWPMLLLQPPASSLRARQTGYKEGHGARQGNLLSWQTPEQRNDEVPLFLFFPLFFWRHSLSLSQELLEDAHAPSLLRLCRPVGPRESSRVAVDGCQVKTMRARPEAADKKMTAEQWG